MHLLVVVEKPVRAASNQILLLPLLGSCLNAAFSSFGGKEPMGDLLSCVQICIK